MAVYRNLQEQVFENAKDIEELQQNTNNLELDIVDEQNKTQQIQAQVSENTKNIEQLRQNTNNLESDMVDVQNKTQQIQVSKDEPHYPGGVMYLHVDDGSTNHYETVIAQSYNLWHIQISSESGNTHVIIEPNNFRYIYTPKDGESTTWSISEQISLNEQIKALLNK